MSIVVAAMSRVFTYSGMTLADPDSTMSTKEVAAFYAARFPELTNAEVHDEGVSADGKTQRYSFQRIAGTKG